MTRTKKGSGRGSRKKSTKDTSKTSEVPNFESLDLKKENQELKTKMKEVQKKLDELLEHKRHLDNTIETYAQYCTIINQDRQRLVKLLDNDNNLVKKLLDEVKTKHDSANMCEYCGEEFSSPKGVKRHITMSHKK